MFDRIIIASSLVALLSGTALAADPLAATYSDAMVSTNVDWSGFYAGVLAGYGRGSTNHTDTVGTTSGDFDLSGGVLGGTLGYNMQVDKVVFGLEGDLALASIDGNLNTGACTGVNCYTNINAFGTARARLGYAFENILPYVTGGLGFAYVDVGQTTGGFGSTSWVAGWVVGGGAEIALNEHLSFKGEALYFNLNDASYTVAIPVNVSNRGVIARAGLNWRF